MSSTTILGQLGSVKFLGLGAPSSFPRFSGCFDILQVVHEALGQLFGHRGEEFHHDFRHECLWSSAEGHRDGGAWIASLAVGLTICLFKCEMADVVRAVRSRLDRVTVRRGPLGDGHVLSRLSSEHNSGFAPRVSLTDHPKVVVGWWCFGERLDRLDAFDEVSAAGNVRGSRKDTLDRSVNSFGDGDVHTRHGIRFLILLRE